MKNYYEILEVNPKASKEVIEKAYKVLVKKYHPDLYTGEKRKYAETKIKEINAAYNILSDEFLREQYDYELKRQETMYEPNIYENQRRHIRQEEQDLQTGNNNYRRRTRGNFQREDQEAKRKQQRNKKYKVGSFSSIFELTRDLIRDLARSKEKRKELKEMTKIDILAIILTIIVVIIIGIILWFIPFTNGWMRELLFENPLFSWIFK